MSEKEKDENRKYQRDRYHMDFDLNEKLKQYQWNWYTSKKIRK